MSTSCRSIAPARTARTRVAVRVAACVLAGVAGTAALGPASLSAASAHEPPAEGTSTASAWYAVPLRSLGGRTLAQYVADHQARVLESVAG